MDTNSNFFNLKPLLENEEWIRSLFETSSDSILIVEQKTGYIIDSNPSACLLYGYVKEEFVRLKITDLSTEPDKTWETLQNSATTVPLRYHRKKDGTVFPVEISIGYFKHNKHSFHTAFIRDITKHIQIENDLRISEAQLSNAMKLARLGHWEYNVDKDIFTFNDNFYAIFCTSADEVGGYTMSSTEYAKRFVHPDDIELVGIEIRKAIETSDPFFCRYIEHRYISANGSEGYIAVRFFVIKNNNGQTIKTYGFNQDITERKLVEKTIKESEERYRMLFENSIETVLLTDSLGIIYDANPAACKIFGLSVEELCAKGIDDLIFKNDFRLKQALEERKQTGVFSGELNFIHRDGSVFTGEVFSTEFKNKFGELLISMFIRDVTKRKQAEDALLEERTLLRNIVDNLPIALYLKDNKARKVLCNPMDIKNIGKPLSEVIGQTDLDLFPREVAEKTYADDLTVLKTGQPIINREEHIINFEGKSKWLYTTKIPRKNSVGEVIGIIGMGLDITALKDVEEELIKAKEKAEESDKLKTAFLCNMSHEIRTPMNAILGFSEFLIRPGLSDIKKVNFSRLIKERAHDLLTIIEDILDISKIEIGQMKLVKSPVNIENLLKNLYEFYLLRKETIKPDSDIELRLNSDDKIKDLYCLTDESRLKQVIINILDNAFKFTDTGVIEMGCILLNNSELLFTFSDTGIGIHLDKQGIVFDRFRQVDDFYETRRFGGTGLGLSIAKGLINLMDGDIWLESKEGVGTKVFFTIPYKKATSSVKEEFDLKSQDDPYWKDKTFLVVEDDRSNAELLKEIILSTHAKLISTYNGKDAIREFKENPDIDLVLLDIRLPDDNGLNLVHIMKGLRPQVPVIAQTAYASSNDSKRCIDAGCDGYISKPILYEELIAIISKFLPA